jgi:hypothetical protein
VAGLIIGLTAAKLNKMSIGFDPSNLSAKVSDTCLLGTGPNNVNLCYAAYGFAGVSVLATGALSLLLCCTCNLCGLGFLLDVVFSLAGTAWWVRLGRAASGGGPREPGFAGRGAAVARRQLAIAGVGRDTQLAGRRRAREAA